MELQQVKNDSLQRCSNDFSSTVPHERKLNARRNKQLQQQQQEEMCHTLGQLCHFYIKTCLYLKAQKKKKTKQKIMENSNISACKNIIFKKKNILQKRNQKKSFKKFITLLELISRFQHKPKNM
jgi:hypothetical protein